MRKCPIYVDMDGCLVGGALDAEYEIIRESEGKAFADGWYMYQHVSDLPLNKTLWDRLDKLHSQGHPLVLWTNRNASKSTMTMENLHIHNILDKFSMFIFGGGNKAKVGRCLDGVIFDNDFKNEVPCLEFNYIHTFMG